MPEIELDIDPEKLNEDFLSIYSTSGKEPIVKLIWELVNSQFESLLQKQLDSGNIHRFTIKLIREGFEFSLLKVYSLKELMQKENIDLGYIKIEITSDDNLSIRQPKYLTWLYPIEIKSQQQKARTKHTILIRSLGFQTLVISNANSQLIENCQCQPELLVPYINGVWDWAIRFICKTCGKSYYCECFHKALDIYLEKAISEYSHGGSMIRQFVEDYKVTSFRSEICHLCRDTDSEIFYCHPMYGSKVMVHYGPYIMKLATEKGISKEDAEREIRDILGISRINEGWITEVELLIIVRNMMKNRPVIHHSSPKWLGRQHLDIYIPSINIAIEYQGRQHYEPVDFFGGKDAFARTQLRDKRKADLCLENDIKLVYFRYDEVITKQLVEKRLKRIITKL